MYSFYRNYKTNIALTAFIQQRMSQNVQFLNESSPKSTVNSAFFLAMLTLQKSEKPIFSSDLAKASIVSACGNNYFVESYLRPQIDK